MGKITFRADDDLVDALETFDTSKSEVMRDALRSYLETSDTGAGGVGGPTTERASRTRDGTVDDSIDELVRERVDALLETRLGERRGARNVDVTIALDGVDDRERKTAVERVERTPEPRTEESTERPPRTDDPRCKQCGERVDDDHVYCPNCGEKTLRRLFCECGDEIRSDWSFCPGCGRRTPAADVLDPT